MSWKVVKISRYSTLGTITDYVDDDVHGFLIRVGNRDPKTGQIYRDTKFTSFVSNIRPWFGKIKVGYYFTSQAINTDEAVEEAEFVLNEISRYTNDFPIFFEVDLANIAKGGRADTINKEDRFKIYQAFNETIGSDIGTGIIIDYSNQDLLDIPKADEIGATIIAKHAQYMPDIPGIDLDGWEYAGDDSVHLPSTKNVSPIIVYHDIAHWEEKGKEIIDYINELEDYIYPFTGQEIKPPVLNPEGLIPNVDFRVFYKNNVYVTNKETNYIPTVTIYGLNGYVGTAEIQFDIIPGPIKGEVIVTPKTAIYTGNPIFPDVKVKGLNYNRDFVVQFQENVNVGNYTILIIGRKNYTGTLTAPFIIEPFELKRDMFIVEDESDTFDDARFEYGDLDDKTYLPSDDLINVDGGENVIPQTDYTHSWDFNRLSVIDTTDDTDQHITYIYHNEQIKPPVHILDSILGDDWGEVDDGRFDYGDITDNKYRPDNDLVDYDGGEEQGSDPQDPVQWYGSYDFNNMLSNWTVEYGENIDVGEYAGSVTVKGTNNCIGEFTVYFDIIKDTFEGEFILEEYEFTYNEKEHRPLVINMAGGLPDDHNFDYTEDYYEKEIADDDDGLYDYGEMNDTSYPYNPDLVDIDGGEFGHPVTYEDDYQFEYGDITDSSYVPSENLVNYDGGDEGDFIKVKYAGDYDFDNLANIPTSHPEDGYQDDHYRDDRKFDYGDLNNMNEDEPEELIDVDGGDDGDYPRPTRLTIYDFMELCKVPTSDQEEPLPPDPEDEYDFNVISPPMDDKPNIKTDVDGGEYFPETTYLDDGRFEYGSEDPPVIESTGIDFDGNENLLLDYDFETMLEDENTYDAEYDFAWLSTLHEGENYDVTYINNIENGTATAIIRGRFPFLAATYIDFHINRIDINSPCYTWRLEYYSHKFLDSIIEPKVYFTKDETAIKEDPTFDVEYFDNVNKGTATVVITGTGHFRGTITMYFIIVAGDLSSDCICRCGEPDEFGLYDFHKFEVYDTRLDKVLTPYVDYYFDNDGHWQMYPYNYSYIRVYRKVTGYYEYTGELECIFPTRLDGIVPVVPTIGGISVEILYMNGGKVPEKEEQDPTPEVIPVEPEPEDPGELEPTGHSDKWVPIEDLFPADRDIREDADPYLIAKYPAGTKIKLYNCKYYSSPENIYPERDRLSGTFYIYNYHIVEQRVRITYTPEQINLPGRTAGWVDVKEIMANLDGENYFRVGDYVLVMENIYRNPDGTGGVLVKKGEYMYIVAIATSLEWEFGDEDSHPKQTDVSNTDFDFNELCNDVPIDDDDYVYDFGTAENPKEGDDDYNFGDEREDPTPEQWDLDFNNFNHSPYYVDDDDYAPPPEYGFIYISDTEYDDWDTDESPYDFLRMAYSDIVYDEAPNVGYGYIIGLARLKNQTPIGWTSPDRIKLATEGDENKNLYSD